MVGPNDLGTAATRTAIANVEYQSEKYESALELYTEVLSVQEGILGRDHMDVAATLQNMGQVCVRCDEALYCVAFGDCPCISGAEA